MRLNILLLLLFFLYSHGETPSKLNLNTTGDEYARAINGYYFDTESYAVEVRYTPCRYFMEFGATLFQYENNTGYMYCVSAIQIIPQLCPSGTEVRFKVGGGCVNKTTNTTVFPVGSRCASQPCQNGGLCFDFPSADAYYCNCYPPYSGLHCHLQQWECPLSLCGIKTREIFPICQPYTSDSALRYSCLCYISTTSNMVGLALISCHDKNELFIPKCDQDEETGAVPFTNKAYYICNRKGHAMLESCLLNHIWNNTFKKCVPENILL